MTANLFHQTTVSLAIAMAVATTGALAQPSNAFYRDKTVSISVVAAGGLYALNAQLLANHMQRHVPGGPNIVMTVRTGAGGLTNLNYLANAAPRDGTALALIPKDLALYQLISFEGAFYDVHTLNWIGSISPMYTTMLFWHEAPIRTIAEAKSTSLVMAASGATHPTALFPRFMNSQLGTKFKIVSGYRGGADIFLAFENGEAQGTAIAWDNVRANKNAWIQERKVIPLVQLSFDKSSDLPDVPLLRDLMPDDDNRRMATILVAGSKIGMALVAPPGVPAERVAQLRKAFEDTSRDPLFRAEAQKRKLDVDPIAGTTLSSFIDSVMRDASPQLVSRLKAAISTRN